MHTSHTQLLTSLIRSGHSATEAALKSLLELCEQGIGWYRVLPISLEAGFVEYVSNAETLYEINEKYSKPDEMARVIQAVQLDSMQESNGQGIGAQQEASGATVMDGIGEWERQVWAAADPHESSVLTQIELTPLEAFLSDHNKGEALPRAKTKLAVSMGVWFTLSYMLGMGPGPCSAMLIVVV